MAKLVDLMLLIVLIVSVNCVPKTRVTTRSGQNKDIVTITISQVGYSRFGPTQQHHNFMKDDFEEWFYRSFNEMFRQLQYNLLSRSPQNIFTPYDYYPSSPAFKFPTFPYSNPNFNNNPSQKYPTQFFTTTKRPTVLTTKRPYFLTTKSPETTTRLLPQTSKSPSRDPSTTPSQDTTTYPTREPNTQQSQETTTEVNSEDDGEFTRPIILRDTKNTLNNEIPKKGPIILPEVEHGSIQAGL